MFTSSSRLWRLRPRHLAAGTRQLGQSHHHTVSVHRLLDTPGGRARGRQVEVLLGVEAQHRAAPGAWVRCLNWWKHRPTPGIGNMPLTQKKVLGASQNRKQDLNTKKKPRASRFPTKALKSEPGSAATPTRPPCSSVGKDGRDVGFGMGFGTPLVPPLQ